jgi:2-dehydro-3-deoxyphosphogluconate aldolase / (4S)-4-hydroxy-2-oxoglutarate aldolase
MGFSDDWFDEAFATTQVMAILRGFGTERSLEVSRIAWDAGVTSVELPIQTPADVDALRAVAAEARDRGLTVGAGTVIDVEQVAVAKEAGAAYTVSPGFDPDVVRASLDAGLPTLPGVASPTELQAARRLGLGWYKAFPAAQLTPEWLPAMHGPFPDAVFVVTGGITVENAAAFLDAGARVVSLGSALAKPEQLERLKPLVARRA